MPKYRIGIESPDGEILREWTVTAASRSAACDAAPPREGAGPGCANARELAGLLHDEAAEERKGIGCPDEAADGRRLTIRTHELAAVTHGGTTTGRGGTGGKPTAAGTEAAKETAGTEKNLTPNARRLRERYRERRAAGECPWCRAEPVPGYTLCAGCEAAKRKRDTARYRRNVRRGLCPLCRKRRGSGGWKSCGACRRKQRIAAAVRNGRDPADVRTNGRSRRTAAAGTKGGGGKPEGG